MLTGPPGAAIADSDLKSWLPEFNPRISLDLSPLSPPDRSDDADTAAEEPSDTPSPRCSDEAAPPTPQRLSSSAVYANLSEYASMVSKDDCDHYNATSGGSDATPAAHSPLPPPSPSSTSDLQADISELARELPEVPAGTSHSESLGLDFDFHTDPAIDAIATSPLFAVPTKSDTDDKKDQLPAARKGRSRRASIAGMLMRRASRYVDISPSAPPVVASTTSSIEPLPVLDNLDTDADGLSAAFGASAVAKQAAAEEPSPDSLAAAEPAESFPAVPEAAQACPPESNEQEAKPAASIGTHSRSASNHQAPTSAFEAHEAAVEGPAKPVPSAAADHISEQSVEAAAVASDAGSQHGNATEASTEIQPPAEPSFAEELRTDEPLPAPPAIARSVEKRSSRILSGITRKVNHVRQTTSMVLRRSVGSRLSMAPGKSLDAVGNVPAPKPQETATAPDHASQAQEEDPPKYTSDDNVALESQAGCPADGASPTPAEAPASTEEANANKSPAEPTIAAESADTSDAGDASSDQASSSGSDGSAASDAATSISTSSSVEAAVEDTTENAASVDAVSDEHVDTASDEDAGDKDGLHAKATFTKRFGMVRRGTNEAVRNGVSRVKHIFASKRPVAA
ncbi:hypothetical protein H4R23_001679 [Coemansia sp. Cherry 401B]|nr:hypothetical protein H4R23_001679 [Coemansia sp. Cherry 401B]